MAVPAQIRFWRARFRFCKTRETLFCWATTRAGGSKTVTDAMNKTEAAEAIAKALFLTAQLGGEVPLSDEECQFFLDLQKTK